MKKRMCRKAITLLEAEMTAREGLDPDFFYDLKSFSMEHAEEMGIKPEIIRSLLRHG